ncbi:hypothetical protein BT69DRAFT_883682 [Atractiella rhizophila]|nr:hypothetical protein BT69DRAFT_883682 [Atractiella rhizophila]
MSRPASSLRNNNSDDLKTKAASKHRRARRGRRGVMDESESESDGAGVGLADGSGSMRDDSEHSFVSDAVSEDEDEEEEEEDAPRRAKIATPPPPPQAGPASPPKTNRLALWSESVMEKDGKDTSLPVIEFDTFVNSSSTSKDRQTQTKESWNGKASKEESRKAKEERMEQKRKEKKLRQKEKRKERKLALKETTKSVQSPVSNQPSTSASVDIPPTAITEEAVYQKEKREGPRAPSPRTKYTQRLSTDPSYVPKLGRFWTHDERLLEDDLKGLSSWWRGGGRGRGRRGRDWL